MEPRKIFEKIFFLAAVFLAIMLANFFYANSRTSGFAVGRLSVTVAEPPAKNSFGAGPSGNVVFYPVAQPPALPQPPAGQQNSQAPEATASAAPLQQKTAASNGNLLRNQSAQEAVGHLPKIIFQPQLVLGRMAKGGSFERVLALSNPGTQAAVAQLYLYNLGSFAALDRQAVALPPGQSAQVRFSFNPPQDAIADVYAGWLRPGGEGGAEFEPVRIAIQVDDAQQALWLKLVSQLGEGKLGQKTPAKIELSLDSRLEGEETATLRFYIMDLEKRVLYESPRESFKFSGNFLSNKDLNLPSDLPPGAYILATHLKSDNVEQLAYSIFEEVRPEEERKLGGNAVFPPEDVGRTLLALALLAASAIALRKRFGAKKQGRPGPGA